MTSILVAALSDRYGLSIVDEANIDAFLAPAAGESPHAVLFFTGDAAQRAETNDVAVILPEVLRAFHGRLRAAVVARGAEERLKARFHVFVLPSLAVTRAGEPIGVLPKVYDWSQYREKIEAFLADEAPVLTKDAQPRVKFTRSQGADQ